MTINRVTKQKLSLLVNKAWFLPLIISITINLIGGILILASKNINGFYLSVSVESQQTIISITSGSLMTLIGLTFSISMLILSTVSNQFGPRLLPNFLESRITQTTLGFFLGTFVFSLYCIYFNSNAGTRSLQTFYVLFLTISCLVILVIFINKVIQSIQIDYILALVIEKTKSAISLNFPKKEEMTDYINDKSYPKAGRNKMIYSEYSGYVQGIDYDEIKKIAYDHHLKVFVLIRPGDYIYKKSPVMELYAKKSKDFESLTPSLLQKCINVNHARLLNQDIEFGFEQIAEIAVRALSPGINDPYTAKQSVFLLGELFLFIEQYDIEQDKLYYDKNVVGQYRGFTYKGILDTALARLRQAATRDLTVILTIYDLVIQLSSLLNNKLMIKDLLSQANSLKEIIKNERLSKYDQDAFNERQKHLAKIENTLFNSD